jgi:hypothetical protein
MGTEHGLSWLDFIDHIPDRATNALRGPSWGVGELMAYEADWRGVLSLGLCDPAGTAY